MVLTWFEFIVEPRFKTLIIITFKSELQKNHKQDQERMPSFNYRGLNAPVPTPSKRQLEKAQLSRVSKSRKRPIAKSVVKFKRIYRQFSDEFKMVMVALRFGSLTDFS